MSSDQYSALSYTKKLARLFEHLDFVAIDAAVDLIEKAWRDGRQIIALGNGGSSLTALHFINDWNKSIYLSSGIPFRGRTLVDNIGLVMSYANDLSFQDVFAEQLKNILMPGDLVLALSGSGNSENVIRAVKYANEHDAITLGLCGYRGGKLKEVAQHVVWVDIDDMQLAEDVHFLFGHIVMQRLCSRGQ
jgi:D-sedoheptulose 7-phosphate isomerase